MERSDAALAEECLSGDRDAYAALVRRHQDAVYNLALHWTRDRDDAADLAQETFVRGFVKLKTYRAQYSFRNWVLTICANLAKNRIRADQRRRRAHEAHAELFPGPAAAPDGLRSSLLEALGRIPPKLRVPLALKHMEGLSYEEIASVLGIGVSAAKMRVKRARDAVADMLAAETGEADA